MKSSFNYLISFFSENKKQVKKATRKWAELKIVEHKKVRTYSQTHKNEGRK